MSDYLSYTFVDNQEFVETFDELPLWSASFGLLLLKHLNIQPNITVVDLGSGTGFPLLELAGRLGNTCKLIGIDPWQNANARARKKLSNYGYDNVEIIESSADKIPIIDNSVDLIVSNLGINNFEHPQLVFKESYRILKPKGKLALTTNLNGHWKEFYTVFENTLRLLGKNQALDQLIEHQIHRGNEDSVSTLFTENGLKVTRQFTDNFEIKFNDGSSFLNHHFVKLGWLDSWRKLFDKEELPAIFSALENNLNAFSKISGGLNLSVPMLYMEGEKY